MSAFGNSWLGNSWLGNSWLGNSWGPGGSGSGGSFAMDPKDTELVNKAVWNRKLGDFPQSYWNPDLLAQVGVLQFMELDWKTAIDKGVPLFQESVRKEAFGADNVEREIGVLKGHITSGARESARGEIIQQDQNFQLYWLQMMMMSQASHPATFLLLKIAARVGEIVMIHYKYEFKRPRPSQICPALLPLLEVPGHAAFPSGHSLLSHLTSNCLSHLAPWARSTLTQLADRVAKNREIAGLHYPSDSAAGCQVAKVLHDVLLPECKIFAQTRKRAEAEWGHGSASAA